MTTVSILIPQYGRTGFTERAVAAVRRSVGEVELDIHVHDNASAGGPGGIEAASDVNLSQSTTNLGFGPAMNLMAERAGGEFLLLLNNDTMVHPQAIQHMVRAVRAGARGPVVPLYRDFEGRSLELGGGLGEGATPWQLFHRQEPPTGLRTTAHRADYGSAAAMLIPRELFLAHGGFDDVYAPAYYEDTDLCMRLAADGRPVTVEPRALVLHYEGGTAGTDLTSGLKTYQVRNRSTFVDRWSESVADNGTVGLHRAIQAATTPASGQPRVLWLGPTLPRSDRDGGGRRTLEMVTALRSQGAGIAFHARSCHDPDRHGRRLSDLGIVWFGRSGPARWSGGLRDMAAYDDLRELLPAAPWDVVVAFSARLAREVVDDIREQAPDAAFVVDNGDLHFLRHERGRALGVEITDNLTKDQELDSYAAADGVITSSVPEDAVLHEELRGASTHVFTVAPPRPVALPPAPDGALMFLGNFGHPPNTDAVSYWVDELASRVAERVGDATPLRVVGAGTDGLPSSEALDVVGWVPELATEFARTRVFVAPLRYGAGTKGKLVETMAHGVPVVTTTAGAEGFPQEVVAAMLVADDPDEFADHVATLASDDAVWAEQRRRVIDAAAWFHGQHEGAGAMLSSWLLSRAYARRRGATLPTRVETSSADQSRPAWVAERSGQDREFDPDRFPPSLDRTDEPVFVVGAPRSGTSMMAHALGCHPALWTGEESDFLAPLVRAAKDAWEMGRTRGDLHWLAAAGVSWEEFAAWLGLGMNAMYTDRAAGRRWVEQTPQYTTAMPLLADMIPGARFVYMLRDGRSVVHSLRHFVRPVEHERASHLWARMVRAGLEFQASPRRSQIHIVDYASIVSDTASTMAEIYAFLGLDECRESVAFIADGAPINSSFADDHQRRATAPRWSSWTTEEREVFHAAAGDLLVRLGFEPDGAWLKR